MGSALAWDAITPSRLDGDVGELLRELIDAHLDSIELFVDGGNATTRAVHLGYLQGLVRYSKRVMSLQADQPRSFGLAALSPSACQVTPCMDDNGPFAADAIPLQPTDTCPPSEGDLMPQIEDAAQDPSEPTDDRRRRWHHLRPEPRGRGDLMGFNKTWWMALFWIAVVALSVYPFPWWGW